MAICYSSNRKPARVQPFSLHALLRVWSLVTACHLPRVVLPKLRWLGGLSQLLNITTQEDRKGTPEAGVRIFILSTLKARFHWQALLLLLWRERPTAWPCAFNIRCLFFIFLWRIRCDFLCIYILWGFSSFGKFRASISKYFFSYFLFPPCSPKT